MGTKYTTETITGYNASPPVDDGTQSEDNKVKWSTHKDKLADPLKDQVANIDAKLVAMADIGPVAKMTNYTTIASDHQKTIEVDAVSTTITLLAVASAPSGYIVIIKNTSGGSINIDATGAETIDGSTTPITLQDNEVLIVQLNQATTGYNSLQQVASTGSAGLTSANTFTKTQTWSKGADIASATELTIGTDGNSFDVTGVTTITSIATVAIGTHVTLQFDGILTLTHHATNLILPGAANITTAAGDVAIFYEYATGDWRCVSYSKASGNPVVQVPPTAAQGSSLVWLATGTASASASIDFTGIDATYSSYKFILDDVLPATDITAQLLARVSTDGGSTFITTADYRWVNVGLDSGAGQSLDAWSTNDTALSLVGNAVGLGAASDEGISGQMTVNNPSSTTHQKRFYGQFSYCSYANTVGLVNFAGAFITAATDVDAIRFAMSTGNITSGSIRMYGIKDS